MTNSQAFAPGSEPVTHVVDSGSFTPSSSDQELSALKKFYSRPVIALMEAGQVEVAGKGPSAILIRKLAASLHVMSVA